MKKFEFVDYTLILTLALIFMCLGMIVISAIAALVGWCFGAGLEIISNFAIPVGGLIGFYFFVSFVFTRRDQ